MSSIQSKGSRGYYYFCFCVVLLFVAVCIWGWLYASFQLPLNLMQMRDDPRNQVTVRVNTFRRLDLLEFFLDYYKDCNVIKQIQVVWSDQQNKPPMEWITKYSIGKVMFEVHTKDSLNNRFNALQDLPTEAVLSIDDDLIIPYQKIWKSVYVGVVYNWINFKVGFCPGIRRATQSSPISKFNTLHVERRYASIR